jgi:prephenate dehydrogenase
VEHADAELFRGRPYVLTSQSPRAATPEVAEQQFRTWLKLIGADIIEMDADEHDRTVAYTSHLPQLLSTCLAATLSAAETSETGKVFGSALLDMTRLSLSAPDLWKSILETNKPAVRRAIQAFRVVLNEVEVQLEADDLEDIFKRGAKFAQAIRKSQI